MQKKMSKQKHSGRKDKDRSYLVLSRSVNQRLYIGDDIEVVICKIKDNSVRIGISAPVSMPIVRDNANVKQPLRT